MTDHAPALQATLDRVLALVRNLPAAPAPRILALDGRAAAGKTTLALALAKALQGAVIHMDDFFLPPEMRTPQRRAAPGGNVHYERFRQEVLPFLRQPAPFHYGLFQCSLGRLEGQREVAGETTWRIVEGAYALHPALGDYADIAFFYDIAPQEQRRRILKRNGAEKAQVFQRLWIPLEEEYIRVCRPQSRAHLL
ncbi:MAG: uridine kinase [Oligosphaeraceae bacterium]